MKLIIHRVVLFLMAVCLLHLELNAQSIAPSIVNSTGGSKFIGNVKHDFSFGEAAVISTFSDLPNDLVVTQGFLQPEDNPVSCGTVYAGDIFMDPAVCASDPFEIEVLNSTVSVGVFQTGQWQILSPISSGVWTDIPGETGSTYQSPGLLQNAKFRYRVHCTIDDSYSYTTEETVSSGIPSGQEIVATVVHDQVLGDGYQFEVLNPNNVISYEWDFGNGVGFSTDPMPTYFFPVPGQDYTVKVFLEGSCSTIVLSLFMPSVLPVEGSKLTGSLDAENRAVLSWTTFKEADNVGFSIEKSEDGKIFERVGFVPSLAEGGRSQEPLHYQFRDQSALTKQGFYRFVQRDYDGRLRYSNIVSLSPRSLNEELFLRVYPNPTQQMLQVEILTEIEDGAFLRVFNLNGVELMRLPVHSNKSVLDLGHLSAGGYFIHYSDKLRNAKAKFVKE